MPSRRPVSFYSVRQVANPAAGAEFSIRAPGQGIWRIPSLRFRFVADANVASRTITLVIDDATDEYYRESFDVVVAATGDVFLCAFSGAARVGLSVGVATVPLPTDGALLLPGWRLRSITAAIQAGDQYSEIRPLVQEYPVGPVAEWSPGVYTHIDELE